MTTFLLIVMMVVLVIGAVYAGTRPEKQNGKDVLNIICTNPNCGYKGEPDREKQRSLIVFVFLFCLWVLPGIVYYLLVPEFKYWCPECRTTIKI